MEEEGKCEKEMKEVVGIRHLCSKLPPLLQKLEELEEETEGATEELEEKMKHLMTLEMEEPSSLIEEETTDLLNMDMEIVKRRLRVGKASVAVAVAVAVAVQMRVTRKKGLGKQSGRRCRRNWR